MDGYIGVLPLEHDESIVRGNPEEECSVDCTKQKQASLLTWLLFRVHLAGTSWIAKLGSHFSKSSLKVQLMVVSSVGRTWNFMEVTPLA